MSLLWTTVGNAKGRHIPDHVDRRPLPSIGDFDQWLLGQSIMCRTHWSGSKLRMVVRLRRQHETWADISRVVGLKDVSVKRVFDTLPGELR